MVLNQVGLPYRWPRVNLPALRCSVDFNLQVNEMCSQEDGKEARRGKQWGEMQVDRKLRCCAEIDEDRNG
jgi:hypothetical protein